MVMWPGCATTAASPPEPKPGATPKASPMPPLNERVGDDRAAAKEVEEASRLVNAGDTSAVIPKLLNTISKYSGTEAAHEARYWLARAYYKIGGYRDAIDLFNEYLRLAPDGRYAQESKDYIQKLTSEYSQRFLSPEKLDENIQTLTEELNKSPENIGSQLALAELLWKRGNYDRAAGIYKNVVDKHPDQAGNEIIRQRVELLPGGKYVVLTPAEIQRRQAEAQPLVVINTASFQSGRDLLTRETRFYAVTGQVVNRDDSVLYGVQVTVTIYGFGNVVYDTTTANIGRMNPSEIRAFSVRFSNFENVENVNRYECVATFQR
jgi:tetratricopeptide (TPR) repeat protein